MRVDIEDTYPYADVSFADEAVPRQTFSFEDLSAEISMADVRLVAMAAGSF